MLKWIARVIEKSASADQCAGTMASLMVVCLSGLLFSQSKIDVTGTVTTSEGSAAFDVVLTLQEAGISDTTDTAGNFSLFRQGTYLASKQVPARYSTGNNGAARVVCLGGVARSSGYPDDAALVSIKGRTIGPVGSFVGKGHPRLTNGVYLVNGTTTAAHVHQHSGEIPFTSVVDTLVLTYQGVLVEKRSVSVFEGKLDITLESQLPDRKHSVLVASYSNNKAYILSADNEVEWEYGMPGPVQDAWLLPNGNVLLSGGSDVREVTRSKEVVWSYSAGAGEIHNCYPLPGGIVLFGENSSGKLFEINRATDEVVRTIQTQCAGDNHTRFRMVRKTRDNTYLIAARGENNVYELDTAGAIQRKISCDTLKNRYGINWDAVHSALKLENGNILIGGGYNSIFIELDEDDNMVWSLSAADIPEIGFSFAAAGQLLPGGTFLFGAYSSTYKLVEVTRSKKVLWKLQNRMIGDPTHAYVVDCWESAGSTACEPLSPEVLIR